MNVGLRFFALFGTCAALALPLRSAPQKDKPALRHLISNDEVIRAIVRDTDAAGERDRPYLRYFTLTTIDNSGADAARITQYRESLSKLVNGLSWQRKITIPLAIDPTQTILRIDLRKYSWTPETWKKILANYPYKLLLSSPAAQRMRQATGCELPYVRADWFLARAAVPPLYNDLLDLPKSARELESRLIVDVAKNIREETAARAGLTESGEARNNRVVERHESAYGCYWRTYDFSANSGLQNVITHPLDFKEAGGEIIFNLPNGLFGFMVVNAKGERIDTLPVDIVVNTASPRDPVVRNGLTCMGCHTKGVQRMSDRADQFRQTLSGQQQPDYDKVRALALYQGQAKINSLVQDDTTRFERAVREAGAELSEKESVALLAAAYDLPVGVSQAAHDLAVDASTLNRMIAGNGRTASLLGMLKPAGATIRRETWEECYPDVANEVELRAAEATGNSGALRLFICDHTSATIKLFDGRTGKFIRDFATGSGLNHASQMAFGPDDNLYVSIGDNAVQRFDGRTGQFLGTFASGNGLNNCTAMEFGHDGKLYVASAWENQIVRFNATTGQFVDGLLKGDKGGLDVIIHFAISPDGNVCLISGNHIRQGGRDTIKRYNGRTGAFMGDFTGGNDLGRPGRLLFGPDGNLYAAGDFGIKRFDGKTGALMGDFIDKNLAKTGGAFTFGPDGNFYLCHGSPIGVKRFDGKTGQPMGDLVEPGAGDLHAADLILFHKQ